MREIKFRAWDGKEMTYSHDNNRHEIDDFKLSDLFEFYAGENFMQYTGLQDLNGKEIYDGDIVKFHMFTQVLGEGLGVCEGETEVKGVLYWEDLGLAFKEKIEDEDWFYLVYAPGQIHEESFEIIGNIHQNPELL